MRDSHSAEVQVVEHYNEQKVGVFWWNWRIMMVL